MLFGPHRGLLLALPAAVGALLLASACDSEEDQAERRQAVGTLVDAVALEPRPGETGIIISETRSKADAPYYTAGGTLPGDRGTVVALVEGALRAQGWDVFESEALDSPAWRARGIEGFMWQVRGVQESMVAQVSVGWYDVPPGEFNAYPRLPGRVWVAIAVGRKGSNQQWTKLD